MFEGLQNRLQSELQKVYPASVVARGRALSGPTAPHHGVRVVAPPERKYSVWIGGSILGSLSSFRDCWVTRHEYEEFGPHAMVLRRCIV